MGLNLTFAEVKTWIGERMKKVIQIDQASGELDHFIIEPFVPHAQNDEYYICIQNEKDGEEILFYSEGGVDVGDVDSKAVRMHIKIDGELTEDMIETEDFLKGVPDERKPRLQSFLVGLFKCYRKLNFTYSECSFVDVFPLTCSTSSLGICLSNSGNQSNRRYSR